MTKRNHAGWLGVLLAAGLVLAGCHKAINGNAFAGAAPEIKAVWDQAVAADKANDYETAISGYRQLLRERDQLSADQIKTVQDASNEFYQHLAEAARGGDAAARKALVNAFQNDQRGSKSSPQSSGGNGTN
jgi:hypothetical protein